MRPATGIQIATPAAAGMKTMLALAAVWLAVSLTLSLPRLLDPAFGVQGDLALHYHITRSMARSVDEGDFAPRWAGLLDGGNGDALFTFYPPLSYLLCALLMKTLRIETLDALRIISWLALFAAQMGAYHFARAFFSRGRSLLVSVCYVALPAYPLLALNRFFIANAVAMAMAPLALLGAWRLLAGERLAQGWVLFAAGASGVLLSHAITTYLCGVAIGLMLVSRPRASGSDVWRGVARLLAASLLVFALTAFFLVPQQLELGWVQIGLQTARQEYRNYFLFAEAAGDGAYRRSWAGLNDVTSALTLAQTALALLLGLACRPLSRTGRAAALPVRFGLALAAFGLLIAHPWSEPLWRWLPGLKFVQFPWRFLPFVSLGCGLLAAALRDAWPDLKPLARATTAVMGSVLILACLLFTGSLVRVYDSARGREGAASLLHSPNLQPVSFEEANRLQDENPLSYAGYAGNQVFFRPATAERTMYPPGTQPGGLSIPPGRGRVVAQEITNRERRFTVECNEDLEARVETYQYPHWVARLGGREIPIGVEAATGRMLVALPAGRHELTISFEPRHRAETWAGRLSLAAWAISIVWLFSRIIRYVRMPGTKHNK
jgi:hypothetical protein